ncbi:hypothetical protein [Clostridium ihumii]
MKLDDKKIVQVKEFANSCIDEEMIIYLNELAIKNNCKIKSNL